MKIKLNGKEAEMLFHLGYNIRRLRIEKGMMQKDLARIAQMQKATISKIEAGRINITMTSLYKIAAALEVDINHFFFYTFPAVKSLQATG